MTHVPMIIMASPSQLTMSRMAMHLAMGLANHKNIVDVYVVCGQDLAFLKIIQVYQELNKYAELAGKLYEAVFVLHNGSDIENAKKGNYECDVCECFGHWFGDYVLEHHKLPDETVAQHQLQMLASDFSNGC